MVIFEQDSLRISLILPDLVRIENGSWTDLPSQTVLFRDFGHIPHSVRQKGHLLCIKTKDAVFRVELPGGNMHCITLSDGSIHTDFVSGRLPGTARTLDQANGAVRLERGILSRTGVSMMDDSESLLIQSDGSLSPRKASSDLYYFACGRDYRKQLQTFYKITGPVPLIPRFALGNWWSRYRAYTQEEYRTLMETFIEKKIPITVATIDMDWHWTDVVSRFGDKAKPGKPRCKEEVIFNTLMPGWTGYSWNTELFPDHRELLNWLHKQGFKVPLNVHPSQGIRFFEDAYEAMCRRMGKDPGSREPIEFDAADSDFMKAYFEEVHHPLEKEGVDFWWLDWQQGKVTKIPGLDPLWVLNHFHTADASRGSKRPLILSRYAGLGSHRYPLGFSGDTICSWKSLDFQPYFTNCAANAGYSWWSHDIGGHMRGIQDDELYLRWLQYGVFSPINRLHSSNSDYMGKEPWKRCWAVEKLSEEFLRLRHKLIPYLYAANYETHTAGTPLCQPLYYRYDRPEAYEAKNEYFFGSQLLVSPITTPTDKRLNLASVKTWLPEGRWTDIFNGRIYEGGRWVRLYRDQDSIPVLAREGAIVPMYRHADSNSLSLDQPLEIHIWRGNGSFDLYEDDGETTAYQDGISAITNFQLEETGDTLRFTITPAVDSKGLLPQKRTMYLKFRDIVSADIAVEVADRPVVVELKGIVCRTNKAAEELKVNLLTRLQGSNDMKNRILKNSPLFLRDALSEIDGLWYPNT